MIAPTTNIFNFNTPATATCTLAQIYAARPCKKGWNTLIAALVQYKGADWIATNMNTPIDYRVFLKTNSIQDVIWAMRCNWFEYRKIWLKFIEGCASRANNYADAADAADAVDAVAAVAAADAAAVAAADAADAAVAAVAAAVAAVAAAAVADAAVVAAADAAAADAERQNQVHFLLKLLS